MQKKIAQKMQEEALAEDSKIFEYDEVYDEIAAKRNEEKLAKKSTDANKPKYITKLLETAEKRKKEHERRVERQVQKEREAEGEEFKDKESFVTSTYRKKLEEMKEAEEAEKREAYLENIGDVTKQQDISGFYRHIYEQKMSTETSTTEKDTAVPVAAPEPSKKKNYRKRKSSADLKEESDKEEKESAKPEAHITSNLDADSDFSIDSESESEEKATKVEAKVEQPEPSTEPSTAPEANGKTEEPAEEVKVDAVEEALPAEPPKPKIDIWKKRTVGEVFDQAVERYYQRKAERERAA